MRITKEKLSSLYHSMKSKEVCIRLKISLPTLIRLIKKSNIPLKGKGNPWPRAKVEVV